MKNSNNSLNTATTSLDKSVSSSLISDKQDLQVKFMKTDEKILENEIKLNCEEVKLLLDSRPAKEVEPLNENLLYYEGFPPEIPLENHTVVIDEKFKNIRSFHDIRCFTFFMCLIVMLINALTAGYKNSVVTTIEKRFEFSSSVSGVLSGFLEVGSLIATLLVSYFCSKSHIPRAIALSSILCAIGSFLYALPHLLTDSYSIDNKGVNQTTNDLLCHVTEGFDTEMSSLLQLSPILKIQEKLKSNPECLLKLQNYGVFIILMIANFLIGSSSAPLYTLGTTYIDNHVAKDNSSIYLGFMYSMLAFGPVVGYLAGAGLLQIYVDGFGQYGVKINVQPGDSNWVGAWYSGFVIFGFLIFITSIPFFFFPKIITKNKQLPESETKSHPTLKKHIDDLDYGKLSSFPKATYNLIRNKVFVNVTLAYCFEINIIAGFMLFLPKYIETQFNVDNSMANIYTGGVALPGAIFGIVLGGYLVKTLKMDPRMASKMAITCGIISILGIFLLLFFGCDNIKMAGTITSYNSDDSALSLTSSCNSNCRCSSSIKEPICGVNGITYFSPCHAGCKKYKKITNKLDQVEELTYLSCSCIETQIISNNRSISKNDIPEENAQPGVCKSNCASLTPFLIVLFVITLLTAINQMPMLMVTLRCVKEIEKPFALGFQLLLMRLLAYLPSPLVFGHFIDLSCLVWRKDECEKIGSCLFYDKEKFRIYYGSLASIYKILALILFICLYFTSKKFQNTFTTGSNSPKPNRKSQQPVE